MKMKQVPTSGRRVVSCNVLNVRQQPCRPQRRPPQQHRACSSVVPASLPQQPRIQALEVEECISRNVVTRVSHNDGLEVRPDTKQQPTDSRTAAGANPDLLDAPCRLSIPERCHSTRSWQPIVARLPSGCSEQGLSWACARWVKQGCLPAIAAPAPQPSCKQA